MHGETNIKKCQKLFRVKFEVTLQRMVNLSWLVCVSKAVYPAARYLTTFGICPLPYGTVHPLVTVYARTQTLPIYVNVSTFKTMYSIQ